MSDRLVLFGDFELDRQACELRRGGERIRLQIQPFRFLSALLETPGEVVTRQHLREKLWPSNVYVDFDHGLNNAIARLREALEDDAEVPRYIETLPRIGYRFIHPVVACGAVPPTSDGSDAAPAPRAARAGARALRSGWVLGLAGFAIVLVTAWLFRAALSPPETSEPESTAAVPIDPDAYDAYERGRYLRAQRTKESVARSVDYLRQAVELAPDFAAAHAALADSLVAMGGETITRSLPAEAVRPAAVAAALEAISLDESLAEGHAAYASVLHKLEPPSRENDTMIEREYERALELRPELAEVRLFFGNFLSSRGRSDEAIRQYREALAGEPLNSSIMSRLAMELIDTGGDHVEAMALFDRALELDPWQYNARVRLGWANVMRGDLVEAKTQFDLAEQISAGSPFSLTGQAFVAARLGETRRAEEILAQLKPIAEQTDDPFHVAIVYLGLRDRVGALEWLGRAAQASDISHWRGQFALDSPLYDWLRDDPRFIAIRDEVEASRRI